MPQKKRIAYGRNGVCHTYIIALSSGNEPFKIVSQNEKEKDGHGTCIKCYISRNRPSSSKIKEILAARFIYDPQFSLSVNGQTLSLSACEGFLKQEDIVTEMAKRLCVNIIDEVLPDWTGFFDSTVMDDVYFSIKGI